MMPEITLSAGTIAYEEDGPPATASAPTVVFVHGYLVDAELWRGVAERLAERGVRCVRPTLPLGSHRIPMRPDADLAPRAVAGLVLEFLAALDLDDVTLVGNDSGGAISQYLLDTDPSRIGALVLTNCDAFEQFPPRGFGFFKLARSPWVVRAMFAPLRWRAPRQALYRCFTRRADAQQTARWIAPILRDAAIRRDAAKFVAGVDGRELAQLTPRLASFAKPVLLCWGTRDPWFTRRLAARLGEVFPDVRTVEVPGGLTFVPYDEPERVAEAISAHVGAPTRLASPVHG